MVAPLASAARVAQAARQPERVPVELVATVALQVSRVPQASRQADRQMAPREAQADPEALAALAATPLVEQTAVVATAAQHPRVLTALTALQQSPRLQAAMVVPVEMLEVRALQARQAPVEPAERLARSVPQATAVMAVTAVLVSRAAWVLRALPVVTVALVERQ